MVWCALSGWAAGIDRLVSLSQLPALPCQLPVLVMPVAAVDDALDSSTRSCSRDIEHHALRTAQLLRDAGIPCVSDWATQRKLYMRLRVRLQSVCSECVY